MNNFRNSAWPIMAVFFLLTVALYHLEGRMEMHDTNPRVIKIQNNESLNAAANVLSPDTALARVLRRTQHLEDSSGAERAAQYLLQASANFKDSIKAYLQFKSGQAFMNAGLDSMAVVALEKSLQVKTKSVDAELCLNLLRATRSGSPESQITAIQDFIEQHPDYVPAHFRLGLLRQRRGELQEAAIAYRKVLDIYPAFKEARWNLGLILYQTRQYHAAREEFQHLSRTNRWKGEYHFNLARTLTHLGQNLEAIEAYKQALYAKGGNYPEAFFNLASLYHSQNKHDSAIMLLDKAVRLRPDYAEAWYNLGLYAMENDNLIPAVTCFAKATEFRPQYREAFYNMGLAFSRMNQNDSSIHVLNKALEISPSYHKAREKLAEKLKSTGRTDSLLKVYTSGIQLDPRRADWWFELAELYRSQNKMSGAIGAYLKTLSLEPNHETALNNLGLTYAQNNQRTKAVEIFQEALTRYPESIAMRYNLALQYRMLRRFEVSLMHLEKAERLDNAHLPTLRLKTKVLEKLEMYQEALRMCEKVLVHEPQNESFQEKAVRLRKMLHGKTTS